ncbi:MAG TPA: hypothetical protein PKY30_21255, partial [Myxococcota bacterium]|nr:hypothetical protein [Myxococcota bacterium]
MELPNSGTAEAGVALGVLRRAVSGLLREDRYTSARYVESNLGRWAGFLGDPVMGLLQGYDQRPLPERAEVLAALDNLLGSLGEPEAPVLEPKVRLLPEGLAIPSPRPPQPPPGLRVEEPPLPEPDFGEERSGREAEDVRPEREGKDNREARENREPRERREGRDGREGREPR